MSERGYAKALLYSRPSPNATEKEVAHSMVKCLENYKEQWANAEIQGEAENRIYTLFSGLATDVRRKYNKISHNNPFKSWRSFFQKTFNLVRVFTGQLVLSDGPVRRGLSDSEIEEARHITTILNSNIGNALADISRLATDMARR